MSPQRRALTAILICLLVGGCTGIPSSGPVEEVEGDQGLGESTARYTPARPAPGATPEEIVRGYLEAMLAYPVSPTIAREFLTERAAEEWQPAESTTVYSEWRMDAAGTGERAEVDSSWKFLARLDRQGHYRAGDGRDTYRWTLEREEGEWRIADPPPGTLVTEGFFGDYYRPFDIYFLDRGGERVVPDPVFRVVGDQLPTTLLASLAEGPEAALAAEVTTRVPAAELLRSAVPIDDARTAEVEFAENLRDLSTAEREELGAQLVWTLSAAPRVRAVRISGADGPLAVGGEVRQEASAFGSYAPVADDTRIAAVTDGRLRRIDAETQRALSSISEVGEAVAVAASAEVAATVDPGRTTLHVRGAQTASLTSATGFLGPAVDRDDRVWALDAEGVRLVEEGEVRAVTAEGWPSGVTSFAVSPDGARYAITEGGGSRVAVGPIVDDPEEGTRLGAPQRVGLPDLTGLGSVQWVSGTRLAMLGDGPAGRQVYSARIDGSEVSASLPGLPVLLPRIEPVALATSAGDDPRAYVLDAEGEVRVLTPRGWTKAVVDGVTAIG